MFLKVLFSRMSEENPDDVLPEFEPEGDVYKRRSFRTAWKVGNYIALKRRY